MIVADLTAIIEDAITNSPRSQQTIIGPSELGSDCDHCLITRLAGDKPDQGAPWLPAIGTAVHEWLETVIVRHLATTGTDRWIPEGRVCVGTIAGQPIYGHSDLYDTHTGTVIDYKVVGTLALREARANGPKPTYERQAHLYGRGWVNEGYQVNRVAIWYLPRNGTRVGDGLYWEVDYDPGIAEATLNKADMLTRAIHTHGVAAVLSMAGPHTGTEFTCPQEPKDIPTSVQDFLGTDNQLI
jgi:hypothetical protein